MNIETNTMSAKEVKDVAPTYCRMAEESGETIVGGLQFAYPPSEQYPSHDEIESAAKAEFGANAKLSEHGPDDDDETVTYIIVRETHIFSFATDSTSGEVTADSLESAYARLRANITDSMIADGATLWVEDARGVRMTMGKDAE